MRCSRNPKKSPQIAQMTQMPGGGRATRVTLRRGAGWICVHLCNLWMIAVLGCTPAKLPMAPGGDALSTVEARALQVRTLRAQFDSVARWPGGERRAAGVLLVRTPDEWRLRLVAPFGITVLDALHTHGSSFVTTPLAAANARIDDPAALAAFSHMGPGDSLVFGTPRGAAACVAGQPRDGLLQYWCGGEPPSRWLSIDPATATVRAEAELANGRAVVSRRYDDYRVVDGVPLPFRIVIDYPQQEVTVDIAVSRYELNPPLGDDLFAPPPGARAVARIDDGDGDGA